MLLGSETTPVCVVRVFGVPPSLIFVCQTLDIV